MASSVSALLRVTSWRLWDAKPGFIAWSLLIDAAAAVIGVLDLVFAPPAGKDLAIGALLVGLGIAQAEMSGHIERVRRTVNTVRHVNLTSVWTFAAVLLVSPGTAGCVVVLLWIHYAVRSGSGGRPLHWQVFAAAAVILSVPLTRGVFELISPVPFEQIGSAQALVLLATAAATVVYAALDVLIVTVNFMLRGDQSRKEIREFALDGTNNSLELATNCLGALVALAFAYQPWFVLLVLIPVLVIHRSVLVKELEYRAARDQKTGLLNATAWQQHANRELGRAERLGGGFGVLMVDLDHFKHTNDTYGHPAGDKVLAGVAAVLRDETRQYDSAGRFGGEEFAVVLPEADGGAVIAAAERIRERISQLSVDAETEQGPVRIDQLSASIGVARYPEDANTVENLLKAADNALYVAKRSGRNRVIAVTTSELPPSA